MGTVRRLTVISAMAENARPFFEAVCAWVSSRQAVELVFHHGGTWQQRLQMLYDGHAQLGFVCGLPYVRHLEQGPAVVEPIAAPVMQAPRYGGKPIYFSDILVRADSEARVFASLRGCRLSYNEIGSHSGYNVLLWHLSTLGETRDFFGETVESGAHQQSLQMLLAGEVDAAILDSTVLDTELDSDVLLADRVRVVASLGPSPMPPALLRLEVDARTREALQKALVGMHEEPTGRDLLHRYGRLRFAPMRDADYETIRQMLAGARQIDAL